MEPVIECSLSVSSIHAVLNALDLVIALGRATGTTEWSHAVVAREWLRDALRGEGRRDD